MDRNDDTNEWMLAFARDVLAGRHSSVQGKLNGIRYEILSTPEDAPKAVLRIDADSPEIVARVMLELADAISQVKDKTDGDQSGEST